MNIEGYYIDPQHALGPPNMRVMSTHGYLQSYSALIEDYREMLKKYHSFEAICRALPHDDPQNIYFAAQLYQYQTTLDIFREHGKKIYLMQKDFFKKLLQSEVQASIYESLPSDWACYFAFPENGPLAMSGAYVYIVPSGRMKKAAKGAGTLDMGFNEHASELTGKHPLLMIYGLDKTGKVTFNAMELTPEFKLGPMEGGFPGQQEYMGTLLKAAILCALYVHTADPDLRHLRPRSQLSKSQEIGMQRRGVDVEQDYSSDINMPVELVSWNWQKDPLYTKDQWEVRAHFRNQAHGPGFSLRKLIWVPPTVHHRHAGEDDTSDGSSSASG